MPEPTAGPGTPPAMTRAETNTATRNLAASLGLGGPWADAMIDLGLDLPAVRAAALAEVEKRTADAGTIRLHQIGAAGDDPSFLRTRMGQALAGRMNAAIEVPDQAVQFRGLGLADMARMMLITRGEAGVGFMSREALITRAITTGDLPILLTESGNRVLMAAYQAAPNPLKALARQTTAVDFRLRSTVRLGEMAQLLRVAENGEVQSSGIVEARESYSLQTYARTFGITRQALINDDLHAFSDINAAMGRAAAESEAGLLVTLLTQANGLGPTMGDGARLFATAHGNLGAAAAITVASLSAGRLAMRVQKGTDGVSPINSTAKYLVVSPAKETEAEQAVAAIYAATPPTSNPFSGRLTVLVDARLSGNAWYLWSDPAVMPAMEYAYLVSAPGPQLESRSGWDVLGMEFRCVLEFGCGMTDWRGVYRNPGA